jgi:ribonuclease HI
MVLSFFLELKKPPAKIVLFTDSDTSLGLINRLTFSADLEHLVHAIRSLIDQLSTKGSRFFPRWIPGHAGIRGNELADRCADNGARTTRLNALVYPLPNERFSYLACPEPCLSSPESE